MYILLVSLPIKTLLSPSKRYIQFRMFPQENKHWIVVPLNKFTLIDSHDFNSTSSTDLHWPRTTLSCPKCTNFGDKENGLVCLNKFALFNLGNSIEKCVFAPLKSRFEWVYCTGCLGLFRWSKLLVHAIKSVRLQRTTTTIWERFTTEWLSLDSWVSE